MDVRPFRAFRFNPAIVGDPGLCIAPPYDVIDEPLQERLYRQSPYNIVRIDRGKESAADSDVENVYTRAAALLQQWLERGVLKQDPQDALYGYFQDFEVGGRPCVRKSLIGLARLEDFGPVVRPHEEILPKPMLDRLHLKRATAAQLGLVFMLYEDPAAVVERILDKALAPGPQGDSVLVDAVDEQGVRHRLCAVTAVEDIRQITRMMAPKPCIIADGHHRYTTGLRFAEESGHPGARYQMMALTNVCQQGLVVLGTHRLVRGLRDFDGDGLLAGLQGSFHLERWPFTTPGEKARARDSMQARMKDALEHGQTALGVYFGQGAFYLARLRDRHAMAAAAPAMSPAWHELDVAVLHTLVLERHLGITPEKRTEGRLITYVKDTASGLDEAVAQVDAGVQQVGFFLNPIQIRQLFAVTDQGQRMPQKSTFFYPKMFTGLTVQILDPMDSSRMAPTSRSQDRRAEHG